MDADDPILTDRLSEQGLRPTRARRLILSHLADRKDHPTTDMISEGLRHAGHRVGTATLYQNLNKLAQAGLLGRFVGPDGMARFDATVAPHPHAVCLRCATIVDAEVDGGALDSLRPLSPGTTHPLEGWVVEGISIDFVGLCPNCRKATNN